MREQRAKRKWERHLWREQDCTRCERPRWAHHWWNRWYVPNTCGRFMERGDAPRDAN